MWKPMITIRLSIEVALTQIPNHMQLQPYSKGMIKKQFIRKGLIKML